MFKKGDCVRWIGKDWPNYNIFKGVTVGWVVDAEAEGGGVYWIALGTHGGIHEQGWWWGDDSSLEKIDESEEG